MDFRITDDQQVLIEGVRDYLGGTHGPEVLRRLDGGPNRDPAIWRGLVEMGLPGLLVPVDDGGLGMGLVEGALIAAECGRVALAEPLVDTAFIAAPWLARQGDGETLAEIAAGEAQPELPHTINPWVVNGSGKPLSSIDPLRNLAEAPAQCSSDPFLLDLGAVMTAAQLIGLADAMLSQATQYAGIRHQFGQPIGAFQAIKHQLASCAVAIEFAKPVVWRAAQALDDGLGSAPVHVSHARIAAGDAAIQAAETAIQVHGAMGYTYEVDLHFWMKRSWALAGAWGSRAFHVRRVEQAVLGQTLAIGAENTFS